MPEGPEIRRAADRVAEAVVGQVADHVALTQPEVSSFSEVLSGTEVCGVETFGKAMVTHFGCGLSVYSHNQLYGRWYVTKPDREPRTNRQLRFGIYTAAGNALLYSASEIDVMPTDEVDAHPFLSKLGPDPLRDEVDESRLRTQLRDERFAGRQLAALLLDQSFVAGIGNYLRSEILFFAGVHPVVRPKELEAGRLRRLASWLSKLPRRAYATGGITDDPRRVRKHKKAGQSRRELRHAVFGRDGRPCRDCETPIERLDVGGRRIYVCPNCQPAPARRRASSTE